MAEKVIFDATNRLIIIKPGITMLNVQADLYSDAKEDWKTDEILNKLRLPFRTAGGETVPGGKKTGADFFLQNQAGADWRIRPDETDHELIVDGNLYPENELLPIFIPTLGDYTVTIRLVTSNLTQVVVAEAEWTPTEKTQIFSDVGDIDDKTKNLPDDPVSEAFILERTQKIYDDLQEQEAQLIELTEDCLKLLKVQEGRWKIDNNQLIIYDEDKTTIYKRFDLLDKQGRPTEISPYERVPV